jgi:hypothetical protein
MLMLIGFFVRLVPACVSAVHGSLNAGNPVFCNLQAVF